LISALADVEGTHVKRDRRFVGYAFSVGDIFVELDADERISDIEGALSWIGFDSAEAVLGRRLSEFLQPTERKVFAAAAGLCRKRGRYGPVRLTFGANSQFRQSFAFFLAQLGDATEGLLIVAVAAARLDGGKDAGGGGRLAEKEEFLERFPETIASYGQQADVALSLLELGETSVESRESFGRQVAALSLGGNTAAEIGEGRFAVLHENAGASQSCFADELRSSSGAVFQAATLPAGETDLRSGDAARAVVYAIRKFADESPDFDLATLASGYDAKLEETRRHIAQLRGIIKERRFKLAFQPIVELATRRVSHFEALVRFDMRGGSPYELITFAEETGMIDEFDAVIMGSVMRRLARSNAEQDMPAIAVNVSARSLGTASFMATLLRHLEHHSDLAGRLLIEVTESAKLDELATLSSALDAIRARGFHICLDDFGAGASGFQYLRDLNVDIVKIDGTYIRDAQTNPRSRAFLHAMVTLCRDLGIMTVGEWVESDAQADLLDQLGVDYGQGFLFGRPRMTLPKTDTESANHKENTRKVIQSSS